MAENVTKNTDTVYQRIYEFFRYVTEEKKMMRKGDFYTRSGLCDGYFRVGNAKGKVDVSVRTIQGIMNLFPNANLEYFIFGKGEMFVREADKEREKQIVVVSDNPKVGMPYFDVDFRGGFDVIENCQHITPSSYISIAGYNKEGNIWCNISGDSMYPVIKSGDKICIREVRDIESISYGDIYAIVTEEMRTVKYVTRSDKEGYIRLVPENRDPKFGDYQDIPMSSITKMFKVLGSVRVFF